VGGAKGWFLNRTNKKNWILSGTVMLVVLLIAGFIYIKKEHTDTTLAGVGACIQITSATLDSPTTSQVNCDDPLAVFVVTATGGSDTSCDSVEDKYTEGKTAEDASSKVCLRFNLKQGECLDPGPSGSSVPKKVSCSPAASVNTVKLLALLTKTSDGSVCPAGSTAISLPLRSLVYCFGPVS